ncbi:T9SS C-terminal target domain-containing protein [Aureibaculum marinum]|uniref:T9SS C-terminal target domain-containing protein n=1 Tax=Aureibaculum marinum TaxID=2487930 RepID=A0A3N4NPT1_9FLAO|nr:T9SS type A sorting domain-containing protein [Aureibaculum marinum]RPD96507.1 T9SS C-terminal target domain-containing protein [Aureibaculum marinum]
MRKNYILVLLLIFVYNAQSQTITTVAGTGSSGFSGDGGLATTAKLNLPFNLTFDESDNIYIADTYNNSIRRIDNESGIITTVVGTADKKKVSELKTPTGLTFDNNNNLYVADLANLRIRKVDLNTGSSITLVGKKSETEFPNIDDSLGGPFNVVFDKEGNLYVSVNGDSNVKKVDFYTGKVTVVAGTGEVGFSGDGGQATQAQLANPTGLALDGKGNLFISDSGNERIRKVNLSTGIITTIAGTGETGFFGEDIDATKAQLANPLGLAIDKSGDLYVVDRGNNMIRKISMSTGKISTIAGNGEAGYDGDGDLARNAKLANPTGLAFNNAGDLYVVDRGNNRIRKITGLTSTDDDEISTEASIKIYPNPSTDKITIDVNNNVELKNVTMFNSNGGQVNVKMNNKTLNVSKLPRGIYVLRITTSEGSTEQKVVLE